MYLDWPRMKYLSIYRNDIGNFACRDQLSSMIYLEIKQFFVCVYQSDNKSVN
jgi:hypothetical protein